MYHLKLPSLFGCTHPIFLVMLLRLYNVDTIAKWIQCDLPLPIVQDRVEKYEVEQILDSQVFRSKLEYLVWCKGYGIQEDGDQPKMLKGQDGWYLSFTVGTQRCCNTYPPLTLPTSPFAPYPTSPIPQTQYPPDGPWVAMCWVAMPLRGG